MSKRRRNKQKRSYLKRYASDYINVHRQPNPDMLKAYAERVLTATGPKHQRLPIFSNTFVKEMPATLNRSTDKTPKTAIAEEQKKKQEIDLLLLAWAGTIYNHGVDKFHAFVMYKHGDHAFKLFFSGTRWCWVEEKHGVVYASCFYSSREKAMEAYNRNRIIWKQRLK